MRTGVAAAGSAIFFAVTPGVVAGVIPFALTGWHPQPLWWPIRLVGAVLTVAGAILLVHAFVRFVIEGRGTPAPVAPTERLVIGGAYRYVRNPMYVAVLSTILGQGLVLGRPVLFGYALVVAIAVVGFVLGYEQPVLRERYGQEYEEYRRAVPGWIPRLTPRRGSASPNSDQSR